MSCKLCKSKPVWNFTNKRTLCRACFVKYFEKKVRGTIRKYNMPIYNIAGRGLRARIVNNILKNLPERKGKLSEESLNDVSNEILCIMTHGRKDELKKLLPSRQPLYFLSDKEILIYARIKGIKGELVRKGSRRIREVDGFVQLIEQKNPDIRHNIVMALLGYFS